MLERCYRHLTRLIPCDVTQVLVRRFEPSRDPNLPDQASYPARQGFTFKCLAADDIHRMTANPDNDFDASTVQLLIQPLVSCLAAFDGQALAGYTFYMAHRVPPVLNAGGRQFRGIGLQLPVEARYLFKTFVLPPYRGKRLLAGMVDAAAARLAQTEVTGLVTTSDWMNVASLRSLGAAGFTQVAMAAEINIGGRHWYRLPAPVQVSPASAQAVRFFHV